MVFLNVTAHLLYLLNINEIISLAFEKKKYTFSGWFLTVFYAAVSCTEYLLPEMPEAVNLLLLLLKWVMPAVILSAVHNTMKKQVVYITFVFFLADSIVSTLGILFTHIFLEAPNDKFILKLVSILFNLVVLFIIQILKKKKQDEIRQCVSLLPPRIYILLMISFFTVSELSGFTAVDFYSMPYYRNIINFIIIVTIMTFLTVMICMISSSISQNYFKSTSKLLNKQINIQIDNFMKTEQLNKSIREFKHDYKNHMICIQGLLQHNKIKEAQEYISKIAEHKEIIEKSYNSGNHIADILLNEKNVLAQKHNCKIKFDGIISNNISAFNICTILSNALDNAIEACAKKDIEDTIIIEVKAALTQNIQSLIIKNPNDQELKNEKTSKSDKINHGFGLYNIKKTITQLGGRMNISQKVPFFVLELEFLATENV